MLTIRLIPCLDVKAGRTVKGVKFISLRDAGDPVQQAKAYDEAGADEICFLDIAASHEERGALIEMVRRTAEQLRVPLTVGGGVRSPEDVRALLLAGADKVAINSAGLKDPNLYAQCAQLFGRQCIVAALDARETSSGYELFTHGGRRGTGLDALAFARLAQTKGAGEILLTSMDKDGTKEGFDIPLLKKITQQATIPVIASGGAGAADHLVAAVKEGGASAVLAASIFHFDEMGISAVKAAMAKAGIAVRPTAA